VKRVYLAVNTLLAHSSCDELRVLRSEIQDKD